MGADGGVGTYLRVGASEWKFKWKRMFEDGNEKWNL